MAGYVTAEVLLRTVWLGIYSTCKLVHAPNCVVAIRAREGLWWLCDYHTRPTITLQLLSPMVAGGIGMPLESALSLVEWEVCGGLKEGVTAQDLRMEANLAEGMTSSMNLATPTAAQVRIE